MTYLNLEPLERAIEQLRSGIKQSQEDPGGAVDICQDCGEYYLEETVALKVYAQAEEALKRHNEVEILQYVA